MSRQKVGTRDFAKAVVARLGQQPAQLPVKAYAAELPEKRASTAVARVPSVKSLVGVDVFVDWSAGSADQLGRMVRELSTSALAFQMITNRGVKVYPEGMSETFCTDHWRCRFKQRGEKSPTHQDVIELLNRFAAAGLDFIKTEQLFNFDGQAGYSLGQGQ